MNILLYDIKAKKIPIGGGFHNWHYENSRIPYCTRQFVVQAYLNDEFDGGETEFLYMNKRISAKQGRIIIFPAGAISLSPNIVGAASDEPWKSFVAKLAMQPDTTTVPFYFEGRNSALFQIARKISLTLGYSLMFREICKRMGTELVVSMRPAIHSSELAEMANRNVVTQFLRHHY